MISGDRPALLVTGVLAVFFGISAFSYFGRYRLPLHSELALYCCLLLLLIYAALPASRYRLGLSPLTTLAVWLVPYFIYAAGTGDFRWPALARLLAVCAPPLVVYCAAPVRNRDALSWQDALAWAWLTLAVVLRQLNGIWNVPASLDFMARLFVMAVASWCWVLVRPVPGLGYDFHVSLRTLRAAALNFAGFAAIAIPVGFALRFAGWNPRWRGPAAFLESYVEILVFIAWLEELFFRGFLQSLLSRGLRSEIRGRIGASVAFGLSHVLLAPAPNWRYVALASIAGWFYGSAFRQGGNLVAPALTHALVDTVWRTWLTR